MKRLPRGEALDRIVAVGLIALAQIELWVGHAISGPKAVVVPLSILMPASVAVRRRWPLEVGVLVMQANGVFWLAGGKSTSLALGVSWMCALYGVAVWTSTRGFVIGLGALVLSNVLAYLGPGHTLRSVAEFTWIPAVVMYLVRRAVRDRQLRAEALAAQAELLERDRELRAEQAVAEERARIARELHDLVAHNVSVMVVQAGAERHALPEGADSTREALTSIETSGRQALAEARRLLGMLRRNGDTGGELEPQPGLAQLDFLVEQIERAGLPVRLEVEGERRPLPAGVDLCAYRVVQESLTNALKHAGPAHAEVRLRYLPAALDVDVADDGSGAQHPNGDGAGHGLIGMRERVALYGGRLEAGPRDGGGFAVHAEIPLA
ncbi:MAG TPA: sensor histidine kinase [Thermoleophilaceae bacterium]